MFKIIEEAKKKLGSRVGAFIAGEYRKEFVGTSRHTIEMAEVYLKFTLPESYKKFVEEYGSLFIKGTWIYGIYDNDFNGLMILDGVRATRDARLNCAFPAHFYVLRDEEGDELHCIDCYSSSSGKIVIWGVYEESVVQELSDSFDEYLEQIVKSALSQ